MKQTPDDYTQHIEPALDFQGTKFSDGEGTPIESWCEAWPRLSGKTAFREALAQAWQDGHDTALIHGQSQNPYQGAPGAAQDAEHAP